MNLTPFWFPRRVLVSLETAWEETIGVSIRTVDHPPVSERCRMKTMRRHVLCSDWRTCLREINRQQTEVALIRTYQDTRRSIICALELDGVPVFGVVANNLCHKSGSANIST